jgi:hypothetical protein
MGVASCRSIFLLSDVVFNHASISPHFGFRFAIGFRSVIVCVVGFHPDPRPSPARPNLGRPGPARGAPHPPRVLPPSLSHSISRAATSSPSIPPLFHLFALGDPVDGYRRILNPKVSSPLPFSLPVRVAPPSLPFVAQPPWPLAPAPRRGGVWPPPLPLARLAAPRHSPSLRPPAPTLAPRRLAPGAARGPWRGLRGLQCGLCRSRSPTRLVWSLRDLRGPAWPRHA